MNSFANSLFSLLFGWAKSLIQQFWTAAVSGQLGGFATWLGDHWLGVALLVGILCTAVDVLIWIIRWKPYLVWRTKLRHLSQFFSGEARKNARRFEEGYQGGVGLDPVEEAPPLEDTWEESDWAPPALPFVWQPEAEERPAEPAPAWRAPSPMLPDAEAPYPPPAYPPSGYAQPPVQQNPGRQTQPAGEPLGGYASPAIQVPPPLETPGAQAHGVTLPYSEADGQDQGADRRRVFTPASDYELPPIAPSARVSAAYGTDMPAARRRRRSEKYEKRKRFWQGRLIPDDDEEDRMLDGLPPAVDRDQAFYEPVYPQPDQSDGYYGWRRPPYPSQTDGNQA